jgi:hypothetical protein
MLALQRRGCHNINFVTPEHVVPQVLEAIAEAVPRGLDLPSVYNTSAYDSIESLSLLEGVVDIYMPDFKFWEPETAKRLAKAKDYAERAREAIREMHRQVGVLRFGPEGLARRGVLVRHLVMPGQSAEAEAIFGWLAEERKELVVDSEAPDVGSAKRPARPGRVRRWILLTLLAPFAILTHLAVRSGSPGDVRERPILLTTLATITGPFTGAIARNGQPCCLGFSLRLALFYGLALARHPRPAPARAARGREAMRLAAWTAGWLVWLLAGPASLFHALR